MSNEEYKSLFIFTYRKSVKINGPVLQYEVQVRLII